MADTNRLDTIDRQMEDLKKKRRAEQNRIKAQIRKEEQHRHQIIGSLIIKHADDTIKALVNKLLTEHASPSEYHLWPDIFPDAEPQDQKSSLNPGEQALADLKETARQSDEDKT